jgi:hypothetical protein
MFMRKLLAPQLIARHWRKHSEQNGARISAKTIPWPVPRDPRPFFLRFHPTTGCCFDARRFPTASLEADASWMSRGTPTLDQIPFPGIRHVTQITDLWAPCHYPSKMLFRFRNAGRDHKFGDRNCTGCASTAGERYPRQHREYHGATCLGLVHAEEFAGKTVRMCDLCHSDPGFLEEWLAGK